MRDGNCRCGGLLGFGPALVFFLFLILPAGATASGFEVNDDGRDLIAQAAQAYAEEMRDRPVVSDRAYLAYLKRVMKRLQGAARPPEGVVPRVTVVDAPVPQVYSYTDGNVVISSAAVLAVDNEAQLAALLAHEMAHLLEGHYILLYQKLKAAERKKRFMATTGALFGALLDSAVTYVADVETAKQTDRVMRGEETYLSAMKSQAKVSAAQSAYFGVKEAIAGIPEDDSKGDRIDPRQRFEVVADIQGMVILARAGYDPAEAARAWRNLRDLRSLQIRRQEQDMGEMAESFRQVEAMMRMFRKSTRTALGQSGLVRTLAGIPPSRPELVAGYVNLREVRESSGGRGGARGEQAYRAFIRDVLLPRAERAMEEENYAQAEMDYRNLYRKGFREAPVLYGLAKCSLGDFAFSASEAKKKEAERLYLEAARKDGGYAAPWKALGELYEDWDRYEEAVQAYQAYLKAAPKAHDRRRISRKIKSLKRKADL